MTKDMKLSELADELERLVSARNEPARLMRADHPQALQVAVATSNRIDRSLAEFVESNLSTILTALRDSTDRDAVLEEAEVRRLAARVCEIMHCEAGQITLHWAAQVVRELKSSPTNPSDGREG